MRYRTKSAAAVAAVLLAAPDARHYGYEVAKQAHVISPVVYPMLDRFLEDGWLTDDWEPQTRPNGRPAPARRYYELTDLGRRELAALAGTATS